MVLPVVLDIDTRAGRAVRLPPPDPINALLSLGYSLVGTEVMGVLSAVGFDPYLGFLHEPRHGRFSLAQDLLEEFRAPAVDRLVLRLVNRRGLRPGHFHEEDGAVSLTKPGFAKFIAAYEAHLSDRFQHGGHETDLRRCFVAQAQALGRALRGEATYRGHLPVNWTDRRCGPNPRRSVHFPTGPLAERAHGDREEVWRWSEFT